MTMYFSVFAGFGLVGMGMGMRWKRNLFQELF